MELPRAACTVKWRGTPLGLPSGSARFQLPPYTRGLRPTRAAGEGLSCSAPILRTVPPPIPRGAPASAPEPGRCASPSPRHDRLGAPKHLSAEDLTRLKRSPCCGPLLRFLRTRGFRRTARPAGSPPQAGACFRALRRVPGPDSHRLDRCSFHNAPCEDPRRHRDTSDHIPGRYARAVVARVLEGRWTVPAGNRLLDASFDTQADAWEAGVREAHHLGAPLSVNMRETRIPPEFSVEGRAWTST
jgi:hypothetical protein